VAWRASRASAARPARSRHWPRRNQAIEPEWGQMNVSGGGQAKVGDSALGWLYQNSRLPRAYSMRSWQADETGAEVV
jgi:hypothetical protein